MEEPQKAGRAQLEEAIEVLFMREPISTAGPEDLKLGLHVGEPMKGEAGRPP